MKAKSNVPKSKAGKLPEPPLERLDPPDQLPEISQKEVLALANAKLYYEIARADYEMKRWAVALKLLYVCPVADGCFSAQLDEQGRVVIRDSSSAGEVDTQI